MLQSVSSDSEHDAIISFFNSNNVALYTWIKSGEMHETRWHTSRVTDNRKNECDTPWHMFWNYNKTWILKLCQQSDKNEGLKKIFFWQTNQIIYIPAIENIMNKRKILHLSNFSQLVDNIITLGEFFAWVYHNIIYIILYVVCNDCFISFGKKIADNICGLIITVLL